LTVEAARELSTTIAITIALKLAVATCHVLAVEVTIPVTTLAVEVAIPVTILADVAVGEIP
jgi:hypothetical protein